MTSQSHVNKPAWVQLYEARSQPQPESRPPGRPPGAVPRHKVGVTLSQGEVSELQAWQEKLSTMLGRKVSTGETVGILVRICSARMTRLARKGDPENLLQLVERMVEAS